MWTPAKLLLIGPLTYLTLTLPSAAQSSANPKFHDTAVISIFHQRNPNIIHFTTIHREQIDDDFDLAVIRGGAPASGWPAPDDVQFLSKGDLLGLFLLSRHDPNRAFEITVDAEAGMPGGRIEVVWTDANAAVLTRTTDYGIEHSRLKYFVDMRSKSLRGKREFAAGGVEIQGEPEHARLVPVQDYSRKRAAVWSEVNPCIRLAPFGYGDRYDLSAAPVGSEGLPNCVVRKRGEADDQTFAVPRSSSEAFAAARPETAGRFFAKYGLNFNETIGPAQIHDGRLWFGVTFYDGEGYTGVGGFGWFDPQTERFELIRPPEMADWSASAILVEQDAVWLGLCERPEGADYSGGLLRWDRASGQVQRWRDIPLIRELRRDGHRLLAGGDAGGAILENGRLQVLFTDVDLEGRLGLAHGPSNLLAE